MKKTTFGLVALLLLAGLSLHSCNKDKKIEKKIKEHEASKPHGSVQSKIYSIEPGDWDVANNSLLQVELDVPFITPSIINSGAVFCYFNTPGTTDNYISLNATITNTIGGETFHYLYYFYTGKVIIQLMTNGNSLAVPNFPLKFKVVAISSTGLIQNPNVDFSNYKATEKAFNL